MPLLLDASLSLGHYRRMVEGPIYHLALTGDWESEPSRPYTTSTIGKTLEEQGFIHCSFRAQVQQIADMAYRGRRDVVLLEIAPTLLTATIQVESVDGSDEAFPHIYGAINRDAVVNATHLRVLGDGRLGVADAL
ncbi:MAG: hypothetical protein QOG46_2486 [Pseudonocardiales bacterium]|nr:hypothetical protein [Pseudonocardiales bacterium]